MYICKIYICKYFKGRYLTYIYGAVYMCVYFIYIYIYIYTHLKERDRPTFFLLSIHTHIHPTSVKRTRRFAVAFH